MSSPAGGRRPQRVAITGSSGLIGGALSAHLRERGDEVVSLVRRPVRAPGEVRWSPAEGQLDARDLAGVTAIVNLAGAGIGDHRWTASYKRELVESRVHSTATIAHALNSLDHSMRLVNGSAIGYYGNRGDEVVDESIAPGTGFLADLVVAWESETTSASAGGAPDRPCSYGPGLHAPGRLHGSGSPPRTSRPRRSTRKWSSVVVVDQPR